MKLSEPARDIAQFRGEIPTELWFGRGTFGDTAEICRRVGRRALLVTGMRAMRRLGYAQQLSAGLERVGIELAQFASVPSSPSTKDVDRGAAQCREFKADFVIALGGGSVMDCAKAIAAVAPGRASANDYLYGRALPDEDTLPIVAIPTTFGTGSELTRSAILTDPDARFRDGIRSNRLFPLVAIVDSTLSGSLDRVQTARTGFDALSHAIESYVSPKARPDTDRLALRAIRYVSLYLPVVLEDLGDAPGREKLAVASTTMGINLSCVGTCFPHRIDKALCALHPEIPHGQSQAAFYPHWLSFSHHGNVARFARIAELMAPEVMSLPPTARAAALSGIVGDFLDRIGLKRNPSDCGVTVDEIPELIERISGDLSANPVAVTREALPDLLRQAFSYNEERP